MSGRRTGSQHVESPVRMIFFPPRAISFLSNGLTKKSARMSSVLLALLAASAGSTGFAQTACPQGVPPGDPRCGPSPSWHQGQTTPEESAAPRVIVRERFQVWEDRFGAIARDPEGPAGMSEGQRSEEDARIAAVADCISKVGDPNGCRNIVFEYASGCAVVAWGGRFRAVRKRAGSEGQCGSCGSPMSGALRDGMPRCVLRM